MSTSILGTWNVWWYTSKMNGWNLKSSPLWKGTSSAQTFMSLGFQQIISRGVYIYIIHYIHIYIYPYIHVKYIHISMLIFRGVCCCFFPSKPSPYLKNRNNKGHNMKRPSKQANSETPIERVGIKHNCQPKQCILWGNFSNLPYICIVWSLPKWVI